VIKQDEKTYWIKPASIVAEEVPIIHAFHLVEGILGRKINTFEFNLLNSGRVDLRPAELVGGSISITIVSVLVVGGDVDQHHFDIGNYLRSLKRVVLGYLVKRLKNPSGSGGNFNEEIGTLAFYDTDGQLVSERRIFGTRLDPSMEVNLLIDPIDLLAGVLAGPIVDILTAAGKAFSGSFRAAMVGVEERLLARGMTSEVAKIRVLTEKELAMVWGRGPAARPLTDNQVETAIKLLRGGHDVHIESIGQMHQIQGKLGQLGVRAESSSAIIPQRPASSIVGGTKVDGKIVGGTKVKEIPGSFRDGPGTYRVDPPHDPGKVPYHPHNEYPHINITLPNGKTLSIIVTGAKSF